MFSKQAAEKYAGRLRSRIRQLEKLSGSNEDVSLHCKRIRGKTFLYMRASRKLGRKETYIRKADYRRIRPLAKKHYAGAILPALKKDLAALESLIRDFSWRTEAELADSLDSLIVEICGKGFESRAAFVDSWLSQTWTETPAFGSPPPRETANGNFVRSKTEELINNVLFSHGLPFFYEKPLYLNGYRSPVFPDFTILDPVTLQEIYWEHFGMMDDPEYAEAACRKILMYVRNGLIPGKNLILTFETRSSSPTSKDIELLVTQLILKGDR